MNLQMPIRLIATDMDGTLLTDEPLILPETADVLRARRKGHLAVTGIGALAGRRKFFRCRRESANARHCAQRRGDAGEAAG